MKVIKKGSMIVVLLAVVAVFLAACPGGSSKSPPPPPPPTTGSFKLTNNATADIDELYFVLSSNVIWGSKQNTNPILAGNSFTVTNIPPGTYDSRAVVIGAVSTYYSYLMGFSITAGNTYNATTSNSGFTGSAFIYNSNGTYSITALYVSKTGYGSAYGPNVLSTPIFPLTTSQFVDISSGPWYVRAVRNGINYDGMVTIISLGYTNITV